MSEKASSAAAKRYANILVVRKGDEKRQELAELVRALKSPEIRTFIEQKYKGTVIPAL